ncbi:MAG TPA: DUF3052 family protein [Candidatus Limnocylindrales bacterium]
MERTYTTPRLDKLGIRPGARVAILGSLDVADPTFAAELAERTEDVTRGEPLAETDVVLLAADTGADLSPDRLRALATRLRPNGAIWVVTRKGRGTTIRDVEVIAAGLAADLVDNKVASFSATHTSLRLVIPVARRPRQPKQGVGRP